MKSPLDDYALGGVSQVPGGYSVILLDKKKPEERIRIEPGSSPDYRVVEVIRKDGIPYGTAVRVSYRGMEKIMEFDEKLLTIKAAPAAKPVRPNGVQPQPQLPNTIPMPGGNVPPRQPRPRVVPVPR